MEGKEGDRETKCACPEVEVVPLVQTLSEPHPPISVPEAPACGEQLHPEDREESGKEVTTSSAFQKTREVLQTQCRMKDGEETGWAIFKPQKTDQTEERETQMDKIDVEDIRAIDD